MRTSRQFGILILLVFMAACSTIDKGADPVVVNAERSVKIAVDTFDFFLRLERYNHVQLRALDPKIHEVAETIRRDAPSWIRSARESTRNYKMLRSESSKSLLATALNVIQAGILEAQKYTKEANSLIN